MSVGRELLNKKEHHFLLVENFERRPRMPHTCRGGQKTRNSIVFEFEKVHGENLELIFLGFPRHNDSGVI